MGVWLPGRQKWSRRLGHAACETVKLVREVTSPMRDAHNVFAEECRRSATRTVMPKTEDTALDVFTQSKSEI